LKSNYAEIVHLTSNFLDRKRRKKEKEKSQSQPHISNASSSCEESRGLKSRLIRPLLVNIEEMKGFLIAYYIMYLAKVPEMALNRQSYLASTHLIEIFNQD